MNKRIKNKSGFTLIEMLVVIAIVGILSATVLTALGPSRNKAKDTRIITGVRSAQQLLESKYNPNNNTYPAVFTDQKTEDEVAANDGILTVNIVDDENGNSQKGYVVYSPLSSDTAKYFCVSSIDGFSGIVEAEPFGNTCE